MTAFAPIECAVRSLRFLMVATLGGCATLGGILPRDITNLQRKLAGGTAQPDTMSTGLVTDTAAIDASPPGYRVSWIKWDSGLRGSGLRIGDRIVAVNGESVARLATLEERQRQLPKAIGQYAESQRWAERGTADGATVTLRVRRRSASGDGSETLDVKGIVAADRVFDVAGRRLIGPGGPPEMASDGFSSAWTAWYEGFVRRCQRVLDGGWQSTMDSRAMLAEHLEDKSRVDYLVQHYPGPFANAVRADSEAVRASLVGHRYEIDASALAYRHLGEERVARIADTGKKARAAFVNALAAQTIPAFPTVDPIRGDRKKVIGKVVILPSVSNRDWVSEAGHGYIAWRGDGGWYFLDSWAPSATRVFDAVQRYRRYVSPRIDERYAIIGRIRPEPKMVVVNDRAVTGLSLDVLGVTVGDQLFVDVTKGVSSPFAGEQSLTKSPPLMPARDASPRRVMEAFIAAVKNGDEQTWKALFATWRAEKWRDDGSIIWYPYYDKAVEREWEDSRRLILDRVYDAGVVYVSDVERIANGRELPNGPVVDQVLVEIDHIGRFDGEYHAFNSVAVHRLWTLQRVDGGPWRIASAQGL